MTTSWSSSINDNYHNNVSSSSSTDHYQYEKSIHGKNHLSSEGSIFSDSDVQQQDEFNKPLVDNFERGPTFLVPNI